MHRGQRV